MDPTLIIGGLADAITHQNLLFIVPGVTIGQVVGAIPGLNILMASFWRTGSWPSAPFSSAR